MAILTTNSRRERIRLWRRQTELMARLEPRLRRQLVDEFRSVGHQAVMALALGRNPENALQNHAAHLRGILEAHYRRVAGLFRKEYTRDLPKALRLRIETKDATNAFSEGFAEWVRKWAALKAASIATTTRKDVREAIVTGEAEGENIDQIAARVRSATGGLLGRARAVTIARTEVHAAANAANDRIGDSLGLGTRVNVWAATEDERTRQSHSDVDGEEWPAGETIHVGDSDLLYPGDPNGEPGDVINCRCTALHRYPEAEALFGSADELMNEDNTE
jgi:uncharacterized protein with gpF-like domain